MPVLIGPDGREFPLADGALVGRRGDDGNQPDVDLTLFKSSQTVSRRHARVRRASGGWVLRVEDRVVNATRVGNQTLKPGDESALDDGDEVVFGAVSMLFRDDWDPDATMAGVAQVLAELRVDGRRFPLIAADQRRLRVGRRSADGTYQPDIDLHAVPNSNTVSHLSGHLYHQGDDWRFQLAKTMNRTMVAGRPVEAGEEVHLSDGDWLQLGLVRVTFHQRAAPRVVDNDLLRLTVAPSELSVETGGVQQAGIELLNASGRVEQMDVEVLGIEEDWYTLIGPDGTRDHSIPVQLLNAPDASLPIPGSTQQLTVVFTPPRRPGTRAGDYSVSISATTRGADQVQRVVGLLLHVLPFEGLELAVEPEEVKGGRGTFWADVHNTSNADVSVDLRAANAEELVCEPAQHILALRNDASRRVAFKVRPRRRRWFGGVATYGFDVQASGGGKFETRRVRLVTAPLIPLWLQFIFGKAYALFSPIAVPAATLGLMLAIAFFLLRPPDIHEFRAEQSSIVAGTPTQLSWRLDRAAGATIEPATAERLDLPAGALTVTPQTRTEYTITARNWLGISSSARTVVDVLRIANFTANPAQLTREREEVTLRWETDGATNVAIVPGDEVADPKPSGEAKVRPTSQTTYRLTATGASGVSAEAQVQVAIGAPVVRRFEVAAPAAGTRIFPGDVVQLTWMADGLTSAALTVDRGDVVPGQPRLDVPSGSPVVVRPSASGQLVYTLHATNAAGTTQAQLTLTVAPLTIAQLDVEPASVTAGQPVRLRWRVEGANSSTSMTLEPGVGRVDGTGERSVTPAESTEYTLLVVGVDGKTVEQRTGVVVRRPLPVINVFTAVPAMITAGEQIRLSWNVANAEQIEIRTSNGQVLRRLTQAEGSFVDTPTSPTTYILEAVNASGPVTRDTSVDVRPPPTPAPPPPPLIPQPPAASLLRSPT